jgi:dihydroxy-acid dehydratase
MTAIAAMGGSTNGVLHILALAREAGVDFTLRDVQAICRRTPGVVQLRPARKRHHERPAPPRRHHDAAEALLGTGLLDGSCLTVTGKTLAENLADAPDVPFPNPLIAPLDAPFKAYADIQICFGNIAPHGMVFKVSSLDEPALQGHRHLLHDSKAVSDAAAAGKIRPGHIVVIRGCGPVAAGMPEMHVASAALAVPELYGKVALLSDTRVSGVSGGAVGVHCSPEAAVGGPIAACGWR